MTAEQFKALEVGAVVLHGTDLYEIDKRDDAKGGFWMSRFSSAMVTFGGFVPFDNPQISELAMPKKKADLKRIAVINERREKTMPRMEHTASRLPDGTVHVQNYITGMYGGMGQHHVHTAEEFAAWSHDIDPKYLHVQDSPSCNCGLIPGQTRECDGHVWSK